jgi:hypothetical protein
MKLEYDSIRNKNKKLTDKLEKQMQLCLVSKFNINSNKSFFNDIYNVFYFFFLMVLFVSLFVSLFV